MEGEGERENEYRKRYVGFQRLLGMEVFTEDGYRVGTIEDVTFNPRSGDLVHFVVTVVERSSGGLLPLPGGGGKRTRNVSADLVKAVGDIVIIESPEKKSSERRSREKGSFSEPSDFEI